MYWWNVKALAEDFREGRVSEKERFKYYLATTALISLVAVGLSYAGQSVTAANLAGDVIGVAIVIAGTILCHRANRSGDDADFIGRMVCLTWPIGVKLAVLFGIVTLIFGLLVFIFSALQSGPMLSDAGWDVFGDVAGGVASIAYGVFYYRLTYKYISDIARVKIDLTE